MIGIHDLDEKMSSLQQMFVTDVDDNQLRDLYKEYFLMKTMHKFFFFFKS